MLTSLKNLSKLLHSFLNVHLKKLPKFQMRENLRPEKPFKDLKQQAKLFTLGHHKLNNTMFQYKVTDTS